MKLREFTVLLVALVAGASSWAQGKVERLPGDGLPTLSPESLRDPPEELLVRLVEGIQAQPVYSFARGLETSDVEKRIGAWSEELGLDLSIRSVGFLRFLIEDLQPLVPVDSKDTDATTAERVFLRPVMLPVFLSPGRTTTLPALLVQDGVSSYEAKAMFRLRADTLAALDFRFVQRVTIVHPLDRVLDHYAANNRSLADVFQELTKMAGVGFANRSEDSIGISMDVSRKPIIDCLRLAATVAGKSVRVEPEAPARSREVSFDDAYPAYTMRKFLRQGDRESPPLERSLDVLHYLVVEQVDEIKRQAPVVLLLSQ